jgi:hypothetical protein
LSLCLTKYHAMKTYWRWVASFTLQPLYPRERAPATHWKGGWVGPRIVLDTVVKRKILSPRRESKVEVERRRHEDVWGSGVISARILNLGDMWRRVVSFTPPAALPPVHHRVQNGSGAHQASYPRSTRVSFPGGKAARAWSWTLTSIYCRGQECVELYLHSPSMSSWRGA